MKKGCLIIILGFAALIIYGLFTAFDPEYDYAEIKQNIGGTLICSSVYNADHHDWEYEISYKYKTDQGSLIDIGYGTYYTREWNKNEQLLKFNNWIILKTGGRFRTDKVIIGNLKTKNWAEYAFTPEKIEKDSLWQTLKISSLLDACCPEAFIDTISNGQIELHYKFRTSYTIADEYDQRKIYYRIKNSTGQPILTKIE